MSAYRQAALVPIEPPERIVFRYVQSELGFNEFSLIRCPLCGQALDPTGPGWRAPFLRWRLCSPFGRAVIGGMLWWKKRCPLPGVHRHARCHRCKAQIVSAPIEVTISEIGARA